MGYGSIALGLLPRSEQIDLAVQMLDKSTPSIRLLGFETLLAEHAKQIEELSKALLDEFQVLDLESLDAASKTLYKRAIEALSERGKLTPKDALGLQRHLRGTAAQNDAQALPNSFSTALHRLVQDAAQGAQRALLKQQIRTIIEELPEVQRGRLLGAHSPGEVIARCLSFLSSAKPHAGDTPYLKALEGELRAYLLMRSVRVIPLPQGGVSFEPPVNLAEAILLAMGRLPHPMIVELIHSSLGNSRETVVSRACVALGMTQDRRSARHLMAPLASKDPFTRFAASMALEQLLGESPFVDWIYGELPERAQGRKALQTRLDSKR